MGLSCRCRGGDADLQPRPHRDTPASFAEIPSGGAGSILWDDDATYLSIPLLIAGGGYAFQKVNGTYDGATTGMNTEGAIAGAAILDQLSSRRA